MLSAEFQAVKDQIEKAQSEGVSGDGVAALNFDLKSLSGLLAIAEDVSNLFDPSIPFDTAEGVAKRVGTLAVIATRGAALTVNTADDKFASLLSRAAADTEVCAIIAAAVKLAERAAEPGALPPSE